jgi:hypothetical protein
MINKLVGLKCLTTGWVVVPGTVAVVVEFWCDTHFFQRKILVTWESVHWGPDFWVSEDVDVKTGETNGNATEQPQIAIQSQSGDLGFVDSVFDVTIFVVVESEAESLGNNVLSITTVEFQFVLSLNGHSERSSGVRSEHFDLFDFSKSF